MTGGAQATLTQETGGQTSGMRNVSQERRHCRSTQAAGCGWDRMFRWVERRQDMPVIGVTCCEHAFTRAGVARDLASYKLGCLCILICVHAAVSSLIIFLFIIHLPSCLCCRFLPTCKQSGVFLLFQYSYPRLWFEWG